MKKYFLPIFLVILGVSAAFAAAPREVPTTRPALIGKGSDSFAAQLHYPQAAKAVRKQAAITFYCDIGRDGTVGQVKLPDAHRKREFADAVNRALQIGRFEPAMVDGKPVPVTIGGTVLFLFRDKRPQIVVSLATADLAKIASMSNYIQPQLIGGSGRLRQKVDRAGSGIGTMNVAAPNRPSLHAYTTFDVDYVAAGHPTAEVLAHVDAQGNLTGTQVLAESSPNAGFGKLVARALDGAKFVPALQNGRPTAGDFTLQVD